MEQQLYIGGKILTMEKEEYAEALLVENGKIKARCPHYPQYPHLWMCKNAPVFFFMWMCYDENNEEW